MRETSVEFETETFSMPWSTFLSSATVDVLDEATFEFIDWAFSIWLYCHVSLANSSQTQYGICLPRTGEKKSPYCRPLASRYGG